MYYGTCSLTATTSLPNNGRILAAVSAKVATAGFPYTWHSDASSSYFQIESGNIPVDVNIARNINCLESNHNDFCP